MKSGAVGNVVTPVMLASISERLDHPHVGRDAPFIHVTSREMVSLLEERNAVIKVLSDMGCYCDERVDTTSMGEHRCVGCQISAVISKGWRP